jgi:hypothetical protein
MTPPDSTPMPSVATVPPSLRSLLQAELALPSRLGYTLLLLAALGATGVFVLLLLTEPALPLRTRVAFGGGALIGLAWASVAAWVLTRRRVLYARHRVVATRLAVVVTAASTLGAWSLTRGGDAAPLGMAAVWTGATLLLLTTVAHVQAMRRVTELEQRRMVLERELARSLEVSR